MDIVRLQYLTALGIQPWELRSKKPIETSCSIDWNQLKKAVSLCTACDLSKTRTQTVFGVGNPNANLMIVGEAPGFYEDQQGEPFVGRAGQLLDAMLQAIQLDRTQVYIANILKCRPPGNRDPQPAEVELCTGFLQKQLALVQPKLILAVGRIASHYLLNTQDSMGKMRGKIYHYGLDEIPLIVTYHPAYLLRNPSDKAKALQDWWAAKSYLVTN